MKNYKEIVGIDVSKKTIDVYCSQGQLHKGFVNRSCFFCFENIGYYSFKLAFCLSSLDIFNVVCSLI